MVRSLRGKLLFKISGRSSIARPEDGRVDDRVIHGEVGVPRRSSSVGRSRDVMERAGRGSQTSRGESSARTGGGSLVKWRLLPGREGGPAVSHLVSVDDVTEDALLVLPSVLVNILGEGKFLLDSNLVLWHHHQRYQEGDPFLVLLLLFISSSVVGISSIRLFSPVNLFPLVFSPFIWFSFRRFFLFLIVILVLLILIIVLIIVLIIILIVIFFLIIINRNGDVSDIVPRLRSCQSPRLLLFLLLPPLNLLPSWRRHFTDIELPDESENSIGE